MGTKHKKNKSSKKPVTRKKKVQKPPVESESESGSGSEEESTESEESTEPESEESEEDKKVTKKSKRPVEDDHSDCLLFLKLHTGDFLKKIVDYYGSVVADGAVYMRFVNEITVHKGEEYVCREVRCNAETSNSDSIYTSFLKLTNFDFYTRDKIYEMAFSVKELQKKI